MERVAIPLREMGARVETNDGHAPVVIDGGPLRGVEYRLDVPTAQVKSAVLLAGLAADGETAVVEPSLTRDHTERALEALDAPVRRDGMTVAVSRFQHGGFDAAVPGDVSSAAFLIAAAAMTGSLLTIEGVGLNPTRIRFLEVLSRMGVATDIAVTDVELGEPMGSITVHPAAELHGTTVVADELPSIIDEVPVLAAVAACARGETWFLGAQELRVKESDRLDRTAGGIRALGGHAAAEGEDLVIAGGGLRGGVATSGGDHRLAMTLAVAAVGADRPCDIDGMEAADVSFPGFVRTLRSIGVAAEVVA
jgi:3-phosphoshikimate 1-carboxyvinyltransferase